MRARNTPTANTLLSAATRTPHTHTQHKDKQTPQHSKPSAKGRAPPGMESVVAAVLCLRAGPNRSEIAAPDAGADRCTRPARSRTTNSAPTALRWNPWPARLRRQGILQGSVFLRGQPSRAHSSQGTCRRRQWASEGSFRPTCLPPSRSPHTERPTTPARPRQLKECRTCGDFPHEKLSNRQGRFEPGATAEEPPSNCSQKRGMEDAAARRGDAAAQPPFESLRERREMSLLSPSVRLTPPGSLLACRCANSLGRNRAGLSRVAGAQHRRVRPEPARTPHVQPVRHDTYLLHLPLGFERELDPLCFAEQVRRLAVPPVRYVFAVSSRAWGTGACT